MSGGIIAVVIVGLALIALIVFGIIFGKKVSSLMKAAEKTATNAQDKIDFFTREADAIKNKIDQLTQEVNGMTTEVNDKMKNIDYFSQSITDFQNALDELKQSGTDAVSQFFGSSSKKNSSLPTFSLLKKTAVRLFKKKSSKETNVDFN
ncbi:MAG: DUF948 domain-containing protein [Carnobacterium sp.]|uniref:DUF948 domain-containing protein n=1 Tax=Carnobacterium antarcticum TaxID=2126436 RepID=A0ABW4NJF0_9LACT|nr:MULTISPECIES: DUF948 domain-containing protein [unclassified Carnobacterium]ALV22369.1 Pyridoxamine 5'-phosphate oxidase [Carnobacterium sp. CP1]QQP70304.1 DUF948 domain-containing protein [Carnobacterium sp. CS13]